MKRSGIADIILIGLFVVIIMWFVFSIISFLNTPVISDKTHASVYIEENDIFDYADMLDPPEKYSELLMIDEDTRAQVAEYMKRKNYRLKSGWQHFMKYDPTYEDLIDKRAGFEFEKNK